MALVNVYDWRRKTYRYHKELRALGFQFEPKPEAHWWIEVGEENTGELEDWCFARRLGIETPYSKRSEDYRSVFFAAHKPNFGTNRHLCVYCGIPVQRGKISVDHLIAVKRAQRSRYYLGLLRKWGCESVNDARNLVPCCKRCNSRKGTKAGWWVIRGLLGRKKVFWYSMWLFYGFILALGMAALACLW